MITPADIDLLMEKGDVDAIAQLPFPHLKLELLRVLLAAKVNESPFLTYLQHAELMNAPQLAADSALALLAVFKKLERLNSEWEESGLCPKCFRVLTHVREVLPANMPDSHKFRIAQEVLKSVEESYSLDWPYSVTKQAKLRVRIKLALRRLKCSPTDVTVLSFQIYNQFLFDEKLFS